MSTLNDPEERAALLDGASALRYRAERLAGLVDMKVNSPESNAVQQFRRNADLLTEMADSYDVAVAS